MMSIAPPIDSERTGNQHLIGAKLLRRLTCFSYIARVMHARRLAELPVQQICTSQRFMGRT